MIQFNKANILFGNIIFRNHNFKPYNKRVINFLSDLSRFIIKDKRGKEFPDIISASYWMRRSNLENMVKQKIKIKISRSLGCLFHIVPTNVPSTFIYSLVFGLLTGNSNIIKLSKVDHDQEKYFLACLKKILKKKKYLFLKKFICFIKYDTANEDITKFFFKNCDGRIIWASDETITKLRLFPVKKKSVEILFSDRRSIAYIHKLPKTTKSMENLIQKFYKDTITYDQNACVSTSLLLWNKKIKFYKKKLFWNIFANYIKLNYDLTEYKVSKKHLLFTKDTFDNYLIIKNIKKIKNYLFVVELNNKTFSLKNLRGNYGYFYEKNINSINKIKKIATSTLQTVTYHGISKKILHKFLLKDNIVGIDRIVPIGSAFDFNNYWDGYDIFSILTKTTTIE